MTSSTSEVAVCCSSDSVRSRVLACTSSNRRTFSIAITAWSAKVCSQFDLLVGERSTVFRASEAMTPIGTPVAQHRNPKQRPETAQPLHVGIGVFRVRQDVGNVHQPPSSSARPMTLAPRSGTRELSGVTHEPSRRKIRSSWRGRTRGHPGGQSWPSRHRTAGRPTSTGCCSTSFKVERRAADDLEHVGGGGLLLQRFAEVARFRLHLVEQPRILDRDHGLVGEGLEQGELLVRKPEPGLRVREDDGADTPVVVDQRHKGDAPETTGGRNSSCGFWRVRSVRIGN